MLTLQRPQRLAQLASAVFAAVEAARQRAAARGLDVINLSVGSPDLMPAPHVLAALHAGIDDPRSYPYPLGDLPEFRAAVAGWYGRRFDVHLDPATQVLGLMGSQEGLAHVAQAFTDPGDVVLVPDPGYPIYMGGPVLAGCRLYPVPCLPEHGFRPDLDPIPAEAWRRAKLLILNFPGNPLAATADENYFRHAIDLARQHDVLILHDAAYSELAFDGYRPISFLQVPGAMEVGIEFNSLSKTFNMAGCRVAYAVGNARAVAQLSAAKGHLDYGIFRPIQMAAIAAMTGPQDNVAAMAATYQARRDAFVAGCQAVGWPVPAPAATMFCWAPVPAGFVRRHGGVAGSDSAFATALLEQAGVAVTPGTGFGARGEGYVRIALVQSAERLAEAAARIGDSGLL